ncbi:phosphocholine-specific phospholipase C [Zavarzinia aquatilis]|uniref:phospholipase C n=1 Tax=Zavarzinia aquatilis TaxID=2211142 RepID=A0A317E939_9PROT|nr:phospholipase C, phosphocholine-specific [Zavarzinia aquatilis]PWR22814.1 phospholipase C, phosphocholine-specific [Zavarzinia aquatilis]
MIDESRRNFLKTTATLAGASAAATVFPSAIQQALAIDANNATKSIKDVEHIVILMQENRAFDHYFGTFPGVRGFGDRFSIPLAGGRSVWEQSNGTRIITPYHLDQSAGNAQRVSGTPHSWDNAQAAWDHGRMANWPTYKQDQSMGHYEKAELEFQWALANAFTLCDNYHCGIHAGTNPNRLYHWTGCSGASAAGVAAVTNEWDSLDSSANGYTWKTYPERLEEAGIDWKVYQNLPNNFTDNPLAGFRQYRKANEVYNTSSGFPWLPYTKVLNDKAPLYKGISNTMPFGGLLAEFATDVKLGILPQVSWIVAPDTYSEHPGPSSPVQGAWYIQETLKALTAVPEVWSKTVLIINFDENDGFFDHVPSPAVFSRNPDGSAAGATTMKSDLVAAEYFTHPAPEGTTGQPSPDGRPYGPGPRVPCYVVSPWSKGGWVASETFDHTSVLRFIEARFGVAESNISPYRRAISGDLTSCFDFVNPNAAVPTLPKRSKLSADALRVSQDLKDQVPVPAVDAQSLPKQQAGIRPSRALPYELSVDATVEGAAVRLRFSNSGKSAAVFHVYDKLHLDRIPRRFMVEAGKKLAATFDSAGDAGQYDLWVLGPNSFHRHFTGDSDLVGATKMLPEIAVSYDPELSRLNIAMTNTGARPCRFTVSANAYEKYTKDVRVEAGARQVLRLDISDQGNWYDYTVTVNNLAGFTRRLAGRMETGKPGISDPHSVFEQIANAG